MNELMKALSCSTVRNKDMSWPEEMSFIANSSKMDRHKGRLHEQFLHSSHAVMGGHK